jgi:hypothetical protein
LISLLKLTVAGSEPQPANSIAEIVGARVTVGLMDMNLLLGYFLFGPAASV